MRAGTRSEHLRGGELGNGVNRNSAKRRRQGASVSLPITMLNTLDQTNEALLFNERIKGSNASKIVELALQELFKDESPQDIAKRIAAEIRKLNR
ncbi:hypothetical protein ACFXAP_001680 [Vibrio cholerae]